MEREYFPDVPFGGSEALQVNGRDAGEIEREEKYEKPGVTVDDDMSEHLDYNLQQNAQLRNEMDRVGQTVVEAKKNAEKETLIIDSIKAKLEQNGAFLKKSTRIGEQV
jgi:hypothetical protein